MLGAICGDILGQPYEFGGNKDISVPLMVKNSKFTDDSVCTFAIAEWLMAGAEEDEVDYYLRSYGYRYPSRGYGGTFAKWVTNPHMGPYGSWGNGSAMRVSAVALWGKTEEEVLNLARISCLPTHGHETAIIGAQATAWSIWHLRNGGTKESLKKNVQEKFKYSLDKNIEEIRKDYKWSVKCSETVPPAIQCFLDSNNYMETVKNAVSIGGDADTLAAIAGSIAEAHYGIPDETVEFCMQRLDKHLIGVLSKFYNEVSKR